MTTAYITCFNGRLTAESTLIIEGCEYPIPELDMGTRTPSFRVMRAARDAGYKPHGSFEEALTADSAGGYTIELERL